MKRDKKDEESGGNPFANLDKTTVLQEARAFNETPINARRCSLILSKLLYLRQQGETIGRTEATEAFFAITKLWQSRDSNLRRLVYLAVKEFCDISNDVIIVTSSLTKDMTGREDIYRAPAIRALCCIIDGNMLQAIERYMKQAIVDKNSAVASAALVSSFHLLRKNPEVVRRWANEVQEAVSSDNNMVQFHALGLLYHIRSGDRLAVNKLVQKWSKSSLRSPFATCYLIRLAAKLIEEDEGGVGSPFFQFIESCLRHKCEMVIYEAASAIVRLPRTTSSELAPAISVLQLFCSSPKPALRFAAVRTLNKVSVKHPQAVTSCNVDLEQLITDQNRSIATLAITTLLKTGAESSVERLMKQISSFVNEISDEFKVVVIEAIRSLCARYPRKHSTLMSFLAIMLRDDGGFDYKKSIVDTIIAIIDENSDAKEAGLSHLCEFIEDCEHPVLATRILHLLGREAPTTASPSRYIRFIYNRVILEATQVRAAAVSALAKFGAQCPDLRPSIQVLLKRCLLDTDDEVRDRATYFLSILETENPNLIANYILNGLQVSVPGLERALEQYVTNREYDKSFDLKVVPISALPLSVTEVKKPSLSVETISDKKEKKASRQEIYAEQLAAIPEFANLGPLFKSSQPTALTDEVTEYSVLCIKHIFPQHVVLQFNCNNTLNDQLLEDVYVELEQAQDTEEWTILHTIPLEKLPFGIQSTTYLLLKIPTTPGIVTATFSANLKFKVRDIDPTTGEFESDESYNDVFVLEEIEITIADHVQPMQRTNFAVSWEQIGDANENEDTYALSTIHTLQDAVRELIECMGLGPCERSDRVTEGKSTHLLLLAGVFRGGHEILAKARLALDSVDKTVTMNFIVRSDDSTISEIMRSAVA
ncbi:coatomer subunit gamma family protein [Onchocerca flexuosa]|uniref:Coatomer subunit gamma n=2 Tax=Onchocerca flexuosa TaxID=387005 RepID=A0A238BQH7_9BILA|nr:coatomer subunit gamma family protein [Onchocerca flexuosa]